MADEPNGGAAATAGADTGAAGAGSAAAGTPAAGAAAAAGSPPAAAAAAAGAAAQTPEQIAAAKTAADAETARVAAPTPEQKAAEAKAATDKAATDKAAGDAAAGDYKSLKMPEGYKTDESDPVFGEALGLFKDLKIAPEGAQKFLDFTVKRDQALLKAVNDANSAAWDKQAGDWKTATEKEFSAEDLGGAKAAAAKVFDKDALTYLEGLKLTSNPGFVRAMVKISKAIKDDTWVTGNAANGAARTAQAMYPNSKMNP